MNFDVPELGSYSIWNQTYGDKGIVESYVSGFLTGDDAAVVGGYQADEYGHNYKLVLMELDRRGRDEWKKIHSIDGLERVIKLLPVEGGFWVLGRQMASKGREQAWIGMFDARGDLVGHRVIKDSQVDIVPTDIVAAHGDAGFLVSVKLDTSAGGVGGSRIYFLDHKGQIQSQKSFVFGIENAIEGLARVGRNKYAASGRVRDTHRRWAGWIVLLSEDGSLEWQREYSRGSAATLTNIQEVSGGYLVAGGIARPAIKNGDRAGWVIAVDYRDRGDIYWQRYYIGQNDFVTQKLVVNPDGLISVLLSVSGDAKAETEAAREVGYMGAAHVRLLTLSPRGEIFNDNTYFNGVGSKGVDMFLGKNQERIILGGSKVTYTTEPEAGGEALVEFSQDMWALAAVSTDPYDDPCDNAISFLP